MKLQKKMKETLCCLINKSLFNKQEKEAEVEEKWL